MSDNSDNFEQPTVWTEETFYKALAQLEEESGFITIDTMLKQVEEAGYRVNNFFHLDNDKWQANVYKPPKFYECGVGDDPAEAFLNAVFNADLTFNHSHQYAKRNLRRPKD